VRLSDYVVERLGLSHRTAQELIRVEEALVRLPAIAAAFDEGALTSSHVRTLARIATSETESFWLALARRLSVRELAEVATCGASEALGATASEISEHDDARASRLTLDVPAWMAVLWRDTAVLVRRLVGSEATAGECLEVVLAEFGAGAGVEWTEGGVADTSAMAGDARRDLHASAPGSIGRDARALDCELRDLACERQRHEAAIAAHLRAVGRERTHRVDGFASLEDYARERFGLAPRRLYYLLALHRALKRLPRLRASRITLRRLEDEIALWRHLEEARPRVWSLLDGAPIPEGIALVPGKGPRLHASAPSTAVAFVRALEEDVASEPLPERRMRIRLRVEPAVLTMWRDTVAWCRGRIGSEGVRESEILELCLRDFWKTWDNTETQRQRRENPTLERDGWRCTAPGCRSLGSGRLHEHHVVFRSEGGALEDPANLVVASRVPGFSVPAPMGRDECVAPLLP